MTRLTADSRKELAAAKQRAKESGTELHGTFIEALRLLSGEEPSARERKALRPVYLIIACATLRLFHDLVMTGAIKLQVTDAMDLMFMAWRGLRKEAGLGENDARDFALMLDWIGPDRLRYFMRFADAAYELEDADKARQLADQAIEALRAAVPPEARVRATERAVAS